MSAIRKNLQRVKAVKNNPEILPLWLRWIIQKKLTGNPGLNICGSDFNNFPHFNAFLGAWHYRPDSDEMRFLRESLTDASVVIDIGANYGVISCIAAKHCPTARIYAFEPHPETAASCRTNLLRNGLTNVTVIEKAVGRSDGDVGFTSHGSPATNRIARDMPSKIRVQITTLDGFCDEKRLEHIDFLKIDVEGADVEVLEGGRLLFERKKIKAGMIEVCPETLVRFATSVDQMIDFFDSVGYAFNWYGRAGQVGDAVTPSEAKSRGLANAAFYVKN